MVDDPKVVTGRRRRAGDVHAPWLVWILIGFSLVVFAWVLYLTSYKNFYYDEWNFVVSGRQWNLSSFLLPHNEHWTTLPIFVWKLLFIVVGLRSHIPYQAVQLAVHLAAVFLLFALVRRRSGDLPAFAAGLSLLVIGGGAINIVWAFQITFLGSIAFGLLAMLLLEGDPPSRSRLVLASIALLASLMCSAVGLAFFIAVGVELLVDPRRRRFWPALVAPAAIFAAWWIVYGAELPGSPGACFGTDCSQTTFLADVHRRGLSLGYVATLVSFVELGLATSAGSIFALPDAGPALFPLLAILVAFLWYRERRIQSWQVGMVAGIVAWFTLVGAGRAWLGTKAATDSHYAYVGAVFLLPLLADAAHKLPWGRPWRPMFAIALALVLVANALQVRDLALVQTSLMQTENAELQTVEVFRGAPDMDPSVVLDQDIMPQLRAGTYLAASAALGSPFAAPTIDTLRHLSSAVVDQEMVRLFSGKLTVTPDPSRSAQGLPCQTVDSSAGSTIDLEVPDGQSVMFQSTKSGDASLYLGFVGVPASKALHHVALSPSTPEWVYVPNTGRSAAWRLRIQTTPVGTILVCGTASLSADHYGYSPYRIEAAKGHLSRSWSVVPDPSASGGRAARLAGGTHVVSFTSDGFEHWVVPSPGMYDVWFRVRVTNPVYTTPELELGFWDGTAQAWAVSQTFAPSQVGANYSWVKAVSGVMPTPEHAYQFLATFTAKQGPATLSTDWYVDEAVLVPIGTPPPAP